MILNLLKDCKNDILSNPQTFEFKTNAQKFTIHLKIKDAVNGYFPHVGISAQIGLMVLYKKEDDSSWLNIDAYTERQNTEIFMHHFVKKGEEYKILIYGPILSKLEKLEVEIPSESTAEIINDQTTDILVLGGPHSFGIGCTTAAFPLSSIIQRKFDAKMNNLTFNNPNYLENINEYYKNNDVNKKYGIALFEVDYVNQNDETTKKYLKNIIYNLKKHCNNIICWYTLPPYKSNKKEIIQELLKEELTDESIKLCDFSFLYDEEYVDLCTFSGNFINDSGNVMIFKKLKPILEEILIEELFKGL